VKILYVIAHPDLGINDGAGYSTHIIEIVKSWQQMGHEVTIIGGRQERSEVVNNGNINPGRGLKGFIRKMIPGIGWRALRERRLYQHDQSMIERITVAIENRKPDFIYERGYFGMKAGAVCSAKSGIPRILELNAPFPDEREILVGKTVFKRKALNAIQLNVDQAFKIVVVSTILGEFYQKCYHVPNEKLVVIPNAVNPQRFDNIEPIQKNGDKLRIGFVGSFQKYHGVHTLLESCTRLKAKGFDFELFIVGGGGNELLEQYREIPGFVFTGKVSFDQVPDYISSFDICVMADSNWYGSPVKIFEYGILGKFIIAPDVGPVREVMEDGKDGVLITGKEALENVLTSVLENPEKYLGIGDAFRQKVLEKYTWKAHAGKILSLLS
jgi:glycosyltransferase involved in cell wall biosynthesis